MLPVVDGRAELGRWGERLAEEHLAADGMAVLERNWRCRLGEIDLIARDGETIVFCEVKTRRGTAYGTPAEAVTPAKSARLRRLAGRWLALRSPGVPGVRIDVLTVLAPRGEPVAVQHLRGIG